MLQRPERLDVVVEGIETRRARRAHLVDVSALDHLLPATDRYRLAVRELAWTPDSPTAEPLRSRAGESMKFRVERDALADAVSWAARTLAARPTMPVLAGLRLVVAGDVLTGALSSTQSTIAQRESLVFR